MNNQELEFRQMLEKQQPFYEAFYGYRIAPSQLTPRMQEQFTNLIETLKSDLLFYHPEVDKIKLREALIIALTVMHRLDAKHPNVYTKVPEIGMRAFKHADRFLLDNPLPLPEITDSDEVWDITEAKRRSKGSKIRESRKKIRAEYNSAPTPEVSQSVSEFLSDWRKTGEVPPLKKE